MTDGPEGLQHLVAAIEALSDEQRRALAAALGMMPASTFAQRDALLVECRKRFFADRTDNDAAQEIAVQWRRYETTAWRRDRSSASCPSRHVGTPRADFWAIMKIVPHSLRHDRIRQILGNGDYQRAASR